MVRPVLLYDARMGHHFLKRIFRMGVFGVAAISLLEAQPSARSELERILLQNIVPFWFPGVIDRELGGYRLNHDINGTWMGSGPKGVVTQSRTVWFFSRLARSPYGRPEHLDAARHGFRFLSDRLWDPEHGGFFWSVTADGTAPVDPSKHVYGQAFALYALAEFAHASGEEAPLELARKTAGFLERNAHDSRYGGYVESFDRDWRPLDASRRGALNIAGGRKSMNSHLHLMEAFATFHRVTKDVLVRERLIELITICSNSVVRKDLGACSDQHEADWTPVPEAERRIVSYGHDVENVWLLMDATESAGLPDGPLLDLYRSLVDYSLRYGFDAEAGGLYNLGPFGKLATDRNKHWWVQAEALVGFLRMAQRTGFPEYQKAFDKTLKWIVEHQIDWRNGEWFGTIGPDGDAEGVKSGLWKSPYHNGRAMLECLGLLEEK